MYCIAICENAVEDRAILYELLEKSFAQMNELYSVSRFTSGEDFLENMTPYQYDIVIFDIEMARINGIEAARRLREADKSVIIIFTTAHAGKVFGSFVAEPFQYLLKPLRYEQFFDTMQRAIKKIRTNNEKKFCINIGGTIYGIPVHQLLFLQSEGRNIEAVTAVKTYRFYGKLNVIEQETVLKRFIRCHQSFLVNPAHIQRIQNNVICLSNGTCIGISKGNVDKVKAAYMLYIVEETP